MEINSSFRKPRSFTPHHVTMATLLGSPVAGSLVISASCRQQGNRTAANNWIMVGFTLLVFLVLASYIIGPDIHDASLIAGIAMGLAPHLILTLVMYYISREALPKREKSSSQEITGKHPGWKAVGIGLPCGIIIAAILIGVGYVSIKENTLDLGERLELGNDEIYYEENVSETEARQLGAFLRETGYFTDSGASVQLKKEGETYLLSWALKDEAWKDSEVISEFRSVGEAVSSRVFNGEPVITRLCDNTMEVKLVIE